MELDWEMVMFAHRPHADQVRLAESIARTVPGTFRLTMLREPGTCHVNMQRALEAARARYLFLLDEDVEFLQQGWLPAMLGAAKGESVGLVGCAEVKDAEGRARVLAERPEAADGPVTRPHMVPAYVTLIDTLRCRGLKFDVDMPGLKGFSDTDFCYQVASRGLRVVRQEGVVVYHPWKPERDADRAAAGYTTTKQEQEWFHQQVARMDERWGAGRWHL